MKFIGCHYFVNSYYPIILLSNLNPPRLCNCTRLVIQKLMINVIEASILNGKSRNVPIHLKRIQFPIRLAFAITINKSQGQKMSFFTIIQLYVACSQADKPSSLFVLVKDELTINIFNRLIMFVSVTVCSMPLSFINHNLTHFNKNSLKITYMAKQRLPGHSGGRRGVLGVHTPSEMIG
ncbi:Uncharacterized protein FWK35_00029946 [Aphis craccivora]|uniref:ATP-dependent DNA helicase PIF1-like n=1 Tax=Aphis craccivora TaxID=307492 RepID=A0A6G0W121_APHCR|nr:Uncharacterized protein FWK35_00029946 [Aphis craccivora]